MCSITGQSPQTFLHNALTYTVIKVRVQQTVKSQEGSITSYKITNLLQFYQTTMKRTIGEDALMSQTLKEYVSLFVGRWQISNSTTIESLKRHTKCFLTRYDRTGVVYCASYMFVVLIVLSTSLILLNSLQRLIWPLLSL